jgi:Family of unknown function (DUF6370)
MTSRSKLRRTSGAQRRAALVLFGAARPLVASPDDEPRLSLGEDRMKTIWMLGLAAVLALGFVSSVSAEEVTLNGTIMCAKCTLKKADATECQDVLVVKSDSGDAKEYYIAKNAAMKEAGHQCKLESKATVTGEVMEKDGKMWITASKIVKAD